MSNHPYPAREIRWREVDSSNIEAIGWDNEDDLYVRFRGGRVYMYKGVSRQRAVALGLSRSPGQYVNKHVIPHYPSIKVG